jgi:cell division protein FtsQ
MHDAFVYTGLEFAGGEKSKERDLKLWALKILVGILCAAFVFELVLYFILIPCFAPVKISYEGIGLYKPEELSALIVPDGRSWLGFNSKRACAVLSSLSGIEEVSVRKKFPDRVFVTITERSPIALTLATQNERTVAVMVDKTGAVFDTRQVSANSFLPLVTGLPIEQAGEGMRLSKVYHPLLEQIAGVLVLPQKYFAAFSEIHVVPKNNDGYELIFYPIKSHVKILLDRGGLNEDTLKTMIVTLDVLSSIEPDVEEIDLRYGARSYRVKQRNGGEGR